MRNQTPPETHTPYWPGGTEPNGLAKLNAENAAAVEARKAQRRADGYKSRIAMEREHAELVEALGRVLHVCYTHNLGTVPEFTDADALLARIRGGA